ncbi:MAG: DUF1501 domain-containing protein [Jatrophihabitantaceae bacterium]
MDLVTRRKFLVASGVSGAAALAAGAGVLSWAELERRAVTDGLPAGAPVLVILTMYGGNDGLNTLVPYADPAYHAARPDLAYAAEEVLHLDNEFGLNPAMSGFAKLWQRKQLAIVRGVGYPKPDFSHFRSMDIWQTASPVEPIATGWIGRWLDATGDDPVRAISLDPLLPPLAVGSRSTAASLPLASTRPLAPDLASALDTLGGSASADTPAQSEVCQSYRAERTVLSTFADVLSGQQQSGKSNPLQAQLELVGRCVKAGVPTSVYSVSLGNFDTHASETHTQQALLGALDSALSAFLADMAQDPRGRSVVVLAYSEFGRRVAANASQGTDHGSAGTAFVAGVPVRGGYYGDQPSLSKLTDGNLAITTDFRAVYGELIVTMLGTDPARVLDTVPKPLGVLSA